MAFTVRKNLDTALYAFTKALNGVRANEAVSGSFFHADVTSTTSGDFTNPVATAMTSTAATAADLPTTITLANELKHKYNLHLADAVAHKVADVTNVVTSADAVDLASVETLLNSLKTEFNLHIASTTYHYTADSSNTVSTANATNLSTAEALANAIQTSFNAHIQSAPAGSGIALVSP